MTTLTQFRSLVRAEIGDTPGAPLWPDARLDQWTREALREYGRDLPRQVAADLPSIAREPAYALPADAVRVLAVEHPPGVNRALAAVNPWGLTPTFAVFAGRLLLDPAPDVDGQPIRLRYAARYAEPWADSDVLATPEADDDLLVLAVATRALRWLRTTEVRNLRYARSTGSTLPSMTDLASGYQHAFEQALARRRVALRTVRLAPLGP